MILNLQKAISRLEKLKEKIESPDINVIYLLCGNENGGKYTLAHYLNESNITFQVDDEGYEVLNVQNPKQSEIVIENLVEIIPSSKQQQNSIFLKIQGFLSNGKSDQQNKLWCIVCDYVLRLISKTKAKLKIILVLSIQQVSDDDQIFVKFKDCFNNITDFKERSHIIVSKLLSDEEFDEFVEITVQDIKKAKAQCDYIDQIINRSRIYPFFSRQVDASERENLINDLSSTEVNQFLQLKQEACLTRRNIHQNLMKGNDQHKLYNQAKIKLQICLKIINYSLISILYQGNQTEKDDKISKLFKQLWQTIFNSNRQFQIIKGTLPEANLKKFIQMYEQLKKFENKQPEQFSKVLPNYFNFISVLWPKNLSKQGIFTFVQVLSIICKSFNEQEYKQINLLTYQIFFNHQNGFLQDHIMLKGFQSCKQYLSRGLIEHFQNIPSSPKKKDKRKLNQKMPSQIINSRKNYM